MTKYRRTMDLILRLIDEEGLRVGDRLPPEPVLAQRALVVPLVRDPDGIAAGAIR